MPLQTGGGVPVVGLREGYEIAIVRIIVFDKYSFVL